MIDRVDDLLPRMTIEEKISQLRMFHSNQGIELSTTGEMELFDNVKQRLVNGIGGIKNPGESKTVTFTIAPDILAFTGLEMKEVIESGEYVAMVGGSSVDKLKAGFTLRAED